MKASLNETTGDTARFPHNCLAMSDANKNDAHPPVLGEKASSELLYGTAKLPGGQIAETLSALSGTFPECEGISYG